MSKKINKNSNEIRDHCVYYLIFDTVKVYVGMTNDYKRRRKEHFTDPKGKVFNNFEVVLKDLTENEAKFFETFLIFINKTTKEYGGYNDRYTHESFFIDHLYYFLDPRILKKLEEINCDYSEEDIQKWHELHHDVTEKALQVPNWFVGDRFDINGQLCELGYHTLRNPHARYCIVCDKIHIASIWYPGDKLGLDGKICNIADSKFHLLKKKSFSLDEIKYELGEFMKNRTKPEVPNWFIGDRFDLNGQLCELGYHTLSNQHARYCIVCDKIHTARRWNPGDILGLDGKICEIANSKFHHLKKKSFSLDEIKYELREFMKNRTKPEVPNWFIGDRFDLNGQLCELGYHTLTNPHARYCIVCDKIHTASKWYPGDKLGLDGKICNIANNNFHILNKKGLSFDEIKYELREFMKNTTKPEVPNWFIGDRFDLNGQLCELGYHKLSNEHARYCIVCGKIHTASNWYPGDKLGLDGKICEIANIKFLDFKKKSFSFDEIKYELREFMKNRTKPEVPNWFIGDRFDLNGQLCELGYHKLSNEHARYCIVCGKIHTARRWNPGDKLGLDGKICNQIYIKIYTRLKKGMTLPEIKYELNLH